MQKKKKDFRVVSSEENQGVSRKKVHRLHIQRLKRILRILIPVVLALCGTYLLIKCQTYENIRTAAEYPSDTSDSNSFAQFADGIVRYNRDGVAFLNKKNEEQWIQSTQIQNPVITVNDEAFAIADIGGNKILVFSKEGLKGEIETNLPVEKITVSNQGIVSAVLQNETQPKIITYDAEGNILVEQQITINSIGYPTALRLSDDGTTLAVTYLYTEGTSVKSRTVFYNFGKTGKNKTDHIVFSEDYDDTLMADIFFLDKEKSVAVGDNAFVIYEGTEAPKAVCKVDIDQEIESVFHSDKYIGFILLNEDKSGYEVRLYNRNGKEVITRPVSGKYGNAKIDGDNIILTDGSRCCIISDTGINRFNGDMGMDILEIFRAPGINRYYVMNEDELNIIYLTK